MDNEEEHDHDHEHDHRETFLHGGGTSVGGSSMGKFTLLCGFLLVALFFYAIRR